MKINPKSSKMLTETSLRCHEKVIDQVELKGNGGRGKMGLYKEIVCVYTTGGV